METKKQNETKSTMTDDQLRVELRALILAVYDEQSFKIGALLALFRQSLDSKNISVPGMQKLYNMFYAIKNELEKDGLIKTIKQGVYYVSSEGVEEYSEDNSETTDEEEDEPEDPEDEMEEGIQILGEGTGEVYLYYYPAYKELAELKGEGAYRCKIGMTTGEYKKRVTSCSRTEEPEHRRTGLIIKTFQPTELERYIHSYLILQGKKADTPGKEWFLTSPQEIVELYQTIPKRSMESDVDVKAKIQGE